MSESLVIICAWCKRVKNEDGEWIEGEVPKKLVRSHGICEDCEKKYDTFDELEGFVIT